MLSFNRLVLTAVPIFALLGCSPTESPVPAVPKQELTPIGQITDAEIQQPSAGIWPSYGRDYREQRYSPLTQINRETVSRLGLAFADDLETKYENEATPLMVDNTLIFPTNWNIIHAVDAVTGVERWRYDPHVQRDWTRIAYGSKSRGVAVYGGKVYLATMDARLIAIDAATGKLVWEVNTAPDPNVPYQQSGYYISGAPRVAKGKVFIGQGGSEMGIRGYVTAYDAETGELAWRFYTVPGDPSLPFENPELKDAAKTWSGEWWKLGGGGTVWDSIVYDEEFNQLYLGVGNGGPWSRAIRSPGGGDNLFLASIVAVDVDTGHMNWYYQTTPGESWDFTATQNIILTEMEVDGKQRKVLMQAPKNGFFYVIDRSDGKLLRANKFVETSWASHVDLETGRPAESPTADYTDGPKWVVPGPVGGHNWQAMSFDPTKGLAYFPAHDTSFLYALPRDFRATGTYTPLTGIPRPGIDMSFYDLSGDLADNPSPKTQIQGFLMAFDPLTGETRWKVEQEHFWNGGTVATAGGLVFQGNAMGAFDAYNSDTGEHLWSFDTYTSIIAAPITYEIGGVQYVAILTGTGLVENGGLMTPHTASYKYGNAGKLLVFKLDGAATLPQPQLVDHGIPPEQPAIAVSPEELQRGKFFYDDICSVCHGAGVVSAGIIPDLRMMSPGTYKAFNEIVLRGALAGRGMAGFGDALNEEDAKAIQAYIVSRANADRASAESGEHNPDEPPADAVVHAPG